MGINLKGSRPEVLSKWPLSPGISRTEHISASSARWAPPWTTSLRGGTAAWEAESTVNMQLCWCSWHPGNNKNAKLDSGFALKMQQLQLQIMEEKIKWEGVVLRLENLICLAKPSTSSLPSAAQWFLFSREYQFQVLPSSVSYQPQGAINWTEPWLIAPRADAGMLPKEQFYQER